MNPLVRIFMNISSNFFTLFLFHALNMPHLLFLVIHWMLYYTGVLTLFRMRRRWLRFDDDVRTSPTREMR